MLASSIQHLLPFDLSPPTGSVARPAFSHTLYQAYFAFISVMTRPSPFRLPWIQVSPHPLFWILRFPPLFGGGLAPHAFPTPESCIRLALTEGILRTRPSPFCCSWIAPLPSEVDIVFLTYRSDCAASTAERILLFSASARITPPHARQDA